MSVLYVSDLFSSYKPLKFGNSFYPGVFLCGDYCICVDFRWDGDPYEDVALKLVELLKSFGAMMKNFAVGSVIELWSQPWRMKRKLSVLGWRKDRFEVREDKRLRSMWRVTGVVRLRIGSCERKHEWWSWKKCFELVEICKAWSGDRLAKIKQQNLRAG